MKRGVDAMRCASFYLKDIDMSLLTKAYLRSSGGMPSRGQPSVLNGDSNAHAHNSWRQNRTKVGNQRDPLVPLELDEGGDVKRLRR
jgi:hypothetical protein